MMSTNKYGSKMTGNVLCGRGSSGRLLKVEAIICENNGTEMKAELFVEGDDLVENS